MRHNLLLPLIFFLSCQPVHQNTNNSININTCEVSDGEYPVQETVYNKSLEAYELIILNAPLCLTQPITVSHLKISRLKPEKSEENAILKFENNVPSELSVSQSFSLKIVETISENGLENRSSTYEWSPFLRSVAGGAIGGVIAGKLAEQFKNVSSPKDDAPRPSVHKRKHPQATNEKRKIYSKNIQSRPSKGRFFRSKSRKRGFFSTRRRR